MKHLFEYFRLWNKTKQEVVAWDYYKFPDGQLQLKIAKKDFNANDEYVLYASIPNSEALDLYNQFLRLSRGVFHFADSKNFKIVILYAYGSRCDKPENEDDLLVTFTTVFQHADYTLVPHAKQIYMDTIFEPDIDDSSKIVKLPYAKSSTPFDLSRYDLVVFPDESAKARYPKIAANIKKSVVCEKVRDQVTGEIISHQIPSEFPTDLYKILVMDDLCDGGRTFKNVSELVDEQLFSLQTIDLFITHGVFSNNALENLLGADLYDHIYVTNSLPWVEQTVEELDETIRHRVTVINVWNDYD